jgi:ankyrin repeat protein
LNIDCTDPHDDRDKIVAVKTKNGRIISASCEWITAHSLYRSWEDVRTSSQLLWISSAEERGKTMMAIYLSMQLEKAAKQANNTVLYFFIDRQNKKDTAMHVLRGLLSRLLKVRHELTHHLLEEFEVQKEALFSKDAIEALWRVFVKMITDPIAGQVYCIIDGLDYCTDDSLRRLISRITNFFLDEPQTVVDDGFGTSAYNSSSAGRSSEQRRTEHRQAAGLKMMLFSRDRPDWMVEQLSETHRIDIGVRGRRYGGSTPGSARPPPTLASVAASVMHQQRLNQYKHTTQGKSPAENQLAAQNYYLPLGTLTSTQPPTSTSSSTFSPHTGTIAPGRSETPSWQAVAPGTSDMLYVQALASEHPISNEPCATSIPPIGTAFVTPSLSTCPSSTDHNVSFSAPEPSVESQNSNVPPPYECKEDDPSLFNDVKTETPAIGEDSGDPALRLYIEAKLDEICAERQLTTQDHSYIIAALEHRGDDTFLWVDFAIEEIRKTAVLNIETVVNSIPPTLTEMYQFILLGIPTDLVDIVAGLLQWTVCAREPLKILELTVTLGLTSYGIIAAENIVRTAINACGNMLTVNPKDKTVNIVHHSIINFLSDESSPIRKDSRLVRFAIHASQIHNMIANFCIAYLESGCLNAGPICQKENKDAYNQRIAQYPFMTYAASFWPHHFRDAGSPYLDFSSPFFETKSKIRKNWWITYWSFSTGKSNWTAPRDFTLLHLTSYVDLVCVAQQMLQRGDLQARIDKRDSHGTTALEYTVVRGHIDMFRFLIGTGASQKGLDENLLELACRTGQRDIAAELIRMGYNVNVRAQTISVKESAYMMARWLPGVVSQGLDINRDIWSYYLLRDIGQEETPLSKAAMFGHSAIVELLLDYGADINAGTTKQFTPLHAASYQGQTECVEILCKRRANAMAQTVEQWLPFHFAAVRGKSDVVEIFLDMGVPLEAMTVKLKTALHLAAYSGYVDIVRALLNRGANLNLRSYKGETPLHLATRNSKPQVVELLLQFGARRDIVDNENKMPLNIVEKATSPNAKECLRILQTFGMAGYQQWQPPADNSPAKIADDASEVDFNDTASSRRESMVSSPVSEQRPFAPLAAPSSYPIQGLQAEFSFSGHYKSSRNPDLSTLHPTHRGSVPTQVNQGVPFQATSPWDPPARHPSLNRVRSEPTYRPPRFIYDANATIQEHHSQQYLQGNAPPPPYNQVADQRTYQTSADFPEKTPSAVTPSMAPQQGIWQPSTPDQVPMSTPAAIIQGQNLSSRPAPGYPSTCQEPTATSVVQMINSMSLKSDPPPITTPGVGGQPAIHHTASTMPYHHQPNYSAAQVPSSSSSAIHTPLLSISPPRHPATAPAVTPFQPPLQHSHTAQLQQNPQHQFAQHRSQTAPNAQVPLQNQHTQQPYPPAFPPNPYLAGPQQQTYFSQPAQSPHFSGNTTASTYNAAYEYSAPPVMQPYVPNLGVGGNGLLFAPPPQQHNLGKRKSFLGGLLK